jgi:hypothetical protein
MLSAAVLSVNNLVPDYFIQLSLLNPLLYHLPLAPSTGLVLANAGLRDSNDEVFIFYPRVFYCRCYHLFSSFKEMTLEEAAQDNSQLFLNKVVYSQVISEWEKDNKKTVSEWLSYCERFKVPPQLRDKEWIPVYEDVCDASKKEYLGKREREIFFINQKLERSRNLVLSASGKNSKPKG